MSTSFDLHSIRAVDGTQARGFENLCFQLSDPAPARWSTTKTGDPDGGLEWYYTSPDGEVLGFQCKFVWTIDDLIASAKTSFDTVAGNLDARRVSTLTFYAPFDLPDAAERNASGRPIRSARAKWNDAVEKWQNGLAQDAEIAVRLETAGWIFDRLLEPGNGGRLKYFFDRDLLGRDWFETKLAQAVALADERYTPESNVDLVIGRDIDALRLTAHFTKTMTLTKSRANDAMTKMFAVASGERVREGYEQGIADVLDTLDTIRSGGTHVANLIEPFNLSDLADLDGLDRLGQMLGDAVQLVAELRRSRGREGTTAPNSATRFFDSVDDAATAVLLLRRLSSATASTAAFNGNLLITGEAGQGKTHLLVDASRRAMADGGLAICVLGETLDASRDILTQIAERLGLGPMSHDEFLETLSAAAQTTSTRLLIAIDALNESAGVERWPSEFVTLLSILSDYPDLALVVSCRSDFATLVLPSLSKREALGVVERRHPGFLGRELEALEAYFKSVPNAWPKAPLLQPDFSNPLFVKLYAGAFADKATQRSAEHDKNRSAVFDRFIETRVERINRGLQLNPSERRVEKALHEFESRLSSSRSSKIAYSEASELFTSFVPNRTEWPNTLFGTLMSEGVISQAVLFIDHELQPAIQFAYQALGDYRIAAGALARYSEEIEAVRDGNRLLGDDSSVRSWYAAADRNLQSALVVLYPESTGHELLDGLFADAPAVFDSCVAAGSWAGQEELRDLLAMTVETIPHRRPSSITSRTIELARLGQGRESRPNLWDSVLAVTAEPGHILNADGLHTRLANLSRVQRDQFWIEYTWHVLYDDTSPLLRLIRWAERTETPQWLKPEWTSGAKTGGADADIVRLAGSTLVWLLSSSNRFVRDRTTKALVQLLLGHGTALLQLLQRFAVDDVRKVDDAYVTQRLVTVAFGWAMRVGRADLTTLRMLAEFMRDHVLASESPVNRHYPDVLTRDAAQGIIDLATHLLPNPVSVLKPPYLSKRPKNPPSQKSLEQRYERDREDPSASWSSIYYSIFSLGDFGRYEIEPAIRHIVIAQKPASDTPTDPDISHEEPKDPTQSDSIRSNDAEIAEYHRIIEALYSGSDESVSSVPQVRSRTAQRAVSSEWARRWVFNEVIRLGWTPERFTDVETRLLREGHDRRGHKSERIGKKYQWTALFRLVAKLLDNNSYSEHYGSELNDYAGAWQLGMRDIDPSLPPAYFEPPNYYETDDGEWATLGPAARADGSTFTNVAKPEWDVKARSLPDRVDAAAWAVSDIDLPSLNERLIRYGPDGRRWIVVSEQVTHSNPSSTDSWDDGRAEEWTHIYGWLVKAENADRLTSGLETQSLMGRWMPEGGERYSSFLGEIGWSQSWADVDAPTTRDPAAMFGTEVAETIRQHFPDGASSIDDIFVLPASVGYAWEAGTADCSIEKTVGLTLPSPALLGSATVHRHPDNADWYDGSKRIAANVNFDLGTSRGSALVVDEDWLRSLLTEQGWTLVVGMLGERRILAPANKVWQQFDHVASMGDEGWEYGALRPKIEYAYGQTTSDA